MQYKLKVLLFSWIWLLKAACNGTAVCTGMACMAACVGAACNGSAYEPAPPFNPTPSEDICMAQSDLTRKLGINRLLIGIMTEGGRENFERYIEGVPYGLKYLYLAERALPSQNWEACTDSCDNCPARLNGAWWGCWNWRPGEKPGAHLRNLLTSSEAAGQIPMVVYYTFYRTIGEGGGELERGVLRDDDNVRDYFDDWRFMLTVVNEYQQARNKPVMVHIEPDLWGFAQQSSVGRNGPENLQVNVRGTTRGSCPDEENNFAGFARCMVRMARHYAPQATIGLMASGWATGLGDINRGQNLDAVSLGRSTGEYLNKLSANLGDFLVVEFSDRDAGFYAANGEADRWYDTDNIRFPNFHRTFLWGKTLAETVKLPLVWWQIPMGHMGLPNTNRHWRDNRVDYLFDNLGEVTENHGIALAFGPGAMDTQTGPATDGGHLAEKVRAYENSRQALVCAEPQPP